MRKFLKTLLVLAISLACLISCVSCAAPAKNGASSAKLTRAELTADISGVQAANSALDYENTYRIRFVYSFTAKMANSTGRLENKKSIVTVKSFYLPKDNPVITADIEAEIKNLTYRGFTFDKWYTEWDTTAQKGIEGTEFNPAGATFSADTDIFCDRGNLAGLNARWTLADGVLTISGTGAMFDCVDANELDVPWYKQKGSITKIVISDGITYVGNNSFNGLEKVTAIELSNTVTEIGESAFEGCKITKLDTPTSLVSIKKNAFNSTDLKEVVLNDGLVNIGERAFHSSNKIVSIVIPKSVKSIGVAAFHPGATGGSNNKHSLSKVYYGGTEKDFASITIGIDNTWMVDRATRYYYNTDKNAEGNYWSFAEGTNIPVQKCFTIKYIYGNASMLLDTIFVPAEPVYVNGVLQFNTNGTPKLSGVITAEHVLKQNSLSYHNFTFTGFSGADMLVAGAEITADRTYTCNRGKILSPDGGIVWSLVNGVLSISVDPATESRITADVNSRNSAAGGYVLSDFELEALAKYIAGSGNVEAAKAAIITRSEAAGGLVLTADEAKAIIDARLSIAYSIWDFVEPSDTASLWTGSLVSVNSGTGVKSIVIGEGVEYIGKFTFASLSKPTEIILPASLKGIHPNAFDGCSAVANIYYMGNIPTDCPDLAKLTGIRSETYSKITAPTSAPGSYWMTFTEGTEANATEKKLAWTLTTDGKITIGGDSVMYNFTGANQTPWYGAKDSIKSVAFISTITSISEYAFYSYSGVNDISLPINLRKIPTTAFAGTGILNNYSKFNKGLLIINGHLLKVNPSMMNTKMFETNINIYNIAGGALAGCSNVERIFISRTIQNINPDAFNGCNIQYVFFDGTVSSWSNLSANLGLDDAKVYYKSAKAPKEPVYDEKGYEVGLKIVDDTYWTKSGSEYVIWGCVHSFTNYVNNNNGTCTSNATETGKCQYCLATDVREIPGTTVPTAHNFKNPDGSDSDTCLNEGCSATK